MRRAHGRAILLISAIFALAACDSPTAQVRRVIPQTAWTTTFATFPDGSVESYRITATDTSGVAQLRYTCHTTGTPASIELIDEQSDPGMATATYAPETTRVVLALAKNGPSSSQIAGGQAEGVIARVRKAWWLRAEHGDGSVHV